MKQTSESSESPTFFPPYVKSEEVRQIQQRILRVKSAFAHDVGVVPNVFFMPIEDVEQIFQRCKQIDGDLFYVGMKIQEGDIYRASYESPTQSIPHLTN